MAAVNVISVLPVCTWKCTEVHEYMNAGLWLTSVSKVASLRQWQYGKEEAALVFLFGLFINVRHAVLGRGKSVGLPWGREACLEGQHC